MDVLAPDLTDNSKGLSESPKTAPTLSSTSFKAFFNWLSSSFGYVFPFSLKKVQTSVVIVQPGGTGISKSAISAKLAPFPPSRFFISALPSVMSGPKR